MEGLINLIIVYVIFSAISSFIKKANQQQQQQQRAAQRKSGQISRPQPKRAPRTPLEEALSATRAPEPPPLFEDVLELDDDEIEYHAEELPVEPPELPPLPRIHAPVPSPQRQKAEKNGLLPAFDESSYLQGIVLAEVLGPPVSQRHSRRRTR